ncbi:hypothetical protein [Ferrimicrobium sp.]|uniref:hypothetical protein n=1 Tax=Ferrimicrobium sp. TaxID=2926050 RepID=UPI002621DA15|nr:hypothetical protein [Ferrimicrobium sp.]
MASEIENRLPSLVRNDVFILGAGFSKAINDVMPVASELLEPILNELQNEYFEGPRGNEGFEQWLSRLAEPQPYLSADVNLERSAAFMKVSRAIAEVLTRREQGVLKDQLPEWFAKLLFAWHIRQATVISFNYDNLVECGVNTQYLPMFDRYPISVGDVLRRIPHLPPSRQSDDSRISTTVHGGVRSMAGDYLDQPEPWENTFRLIKLHGSISWYWVPNDATGTTLQRWPDVGSFGAPPGNQLPRIRRDLPGREVFIAPPSSTKSRYLSNPVIRQLWSDALEKLQQADRVFILGYSMPTEDQAAMGLLLEGLRQSGVEIHIVDCCADPVKERLVNLIQNRHDRRIATGDEPPTNSEIMTTAGGSPVKRFTQSYFHQLAKEGTSNLLQFAKDLPSITSEFLEREWVGPDDAVNYSITGNVECIGLPIEVVKPSLKCDEITVEDEVLMIKVGSGNGTDARQLTKLMKALQELSVSQGVKTLSVFYGGGKTFPVIPLAVQRRKNESLNGANWYDLTLVPFILQLPSGPSDYSDAIKGP